MKLRNTQRSWNVFPFSERVALYPNKNTFLELYLFIPRFCHFATLSESVGHLPTEKCQTFSNPQNESVGRIVSTK